MKLKKVSEDYHLIKGMGDVIIGKINVSFGGKKPYIRFQSGEWLSQEDLEEINKFMKSLMTIEEIEKNAK